MIVCTHFRKRKFPFYLFTSYEVEKEKTNPKVSCALTSRILLSIQYYHHYVYRIVATIIALTERRRWKKGKKEIASSFIEAIARYLAYEEDIVVKERKLY